MNTSIGQDVLVESLGGLFPNVHNQMCIRSYDYALLVPFCADVCVSNTLRRWVSKPQFETYFFGGMTGQAAILSRPFLPITAESQIELFF